MLWANNLAQVSRQPQVRCGQFFGHYASTTLRNNPEIIEYGSVQVTAYGEGGAHCSVGAHFEEDLSVQCLAPNGTLVDSYFTVLLHS